MRVPVLFTSLVLIVVVKVDHVRDHGDDANNPDDERDHHSCDKLHLTKQVPVKTKKHGVFPSE